MDSNLILEWIWGHTRYPFWRRWEKLGKSLYLLRANRNTQMQFWIRLILKEFSSTIGSTVSTVGSWLLSCSSKIFRGWIEIPRESFSWITPPIRTLCSLKMAFPFFPITKVKILSWLRCRTTFTVSNFAKTLDKSTNNTLA